MPQRLDSKGYGLRYFPARPKTKILTFFMTFLLIEIGHKV